MEATGYRPPKIYLRGPAIVYYYFLRAYVLDGAMLKAPASLYHWLKLSPIISDERVCVPARTKNHTYDPSNPILPVPYYFPNNPLPLQVKRGW